MSEKAEILGYYSKYLSNLPTVQAIVNALTPAWNKYYQGDF